MAEIPYGTAFIVEGTTEEYLTLNGNEWIKLRLTDGHAIMINVKHCKRVEQNDNADGKSDK